MFGLLQLIFVVMFCIASGIIIFTAIHGISTWNKNNHSPRLTVPAKVVAKRMEVDSHYHGNSGGMTGMSTDTTYYVTFQVESGDRMELSVDDSEYGMLVEGDEGKLTFQGSRYLGFGTITKGAANVFAFSAPLCVIVF